MTAWLRAVLVAVLLGGLGFLPSPAAAATCLASATSVSFGIYNVSSLQDSLGTGVVTVTCSYLGTDSQDVTYSIAMTAGSGSFASRKLVSGSGKIAYNIYSDVGLTSVWGDGTGGSTLVSGGTHATLTGASNTYPVYGRIPALQTSIGAGTYSDSVIVTIAY